MGTLHTHIPKKSPKGDSPKGSLMVYHCKSKAYSETPHKGEIWSSKGPIPPRIRKLCCLI